jgi:predicted MFS family arabinose efflux permease
LRLTILQPLRHRDFRLLFIGQTVSQVGNQMYAVALPFQILALGGSPLQLGTGFTIWSGAQLVTVLFGGALVDRLSRRRVILGVDLISALVIGVVASLGLSHHLQIPYLYILSAFSGATFSFYTPAMSAIMPELVPSEVLIPGNALRGLSRQTARIIGPALGGVIVTAAGAPWAFAIDAATFAFSFFVFLYSTPPPRTSLPRKALIAEIRDGVTFTFSVTWIWAAIIGFAVTNSFYFAGFTVAMPLLVLKVLMGSAATYGLIGAAGGVGEIVGGLVVGNLRLRRLGVGIYTFSGLLGLAFTVFGLAPLLPVVLIGNFVFAVTIVIANTLWDTAIQKHVPPNLIGRVVSVDSFGSYLVAPIAPLVAGAVIGGIGPSRLFVFGGLISFGFWMVNLALNGSARRLE